MKDEQGKLKFEGFYKNGEKNGKGKEYEDGNMACEGEYKYGKAHGKGKVYDEDGNLIYEGEYTLGKRLIKKFQIKIYDRKLHFENEIL